MLISFFGQAFTNLRNELHAWCKHHTIAQDHADRVSWAAFTGKEKPAQLAKLARDALLVTHTLCEYQRKRKGRTSVAVNAAVRRCEEEVALYEAELRLLQLEEP